MYIWFVLTQLGWIEIFNQRNPPTYNESKQAWTGRLIHPFSNRDVKAIRMRSLKIDTPKGYFLVPEINKPDNPTEYYLQRVRDTNQLAFKRRRRFLSDVTITIFCSRLMKFLGIDSLEYNGKMIFIEIESSSVIN